jgi:hypothetical protein
MRSDEHLRCRVCGLLLAAPPWGDDGRTPLFDHCPCCGVEFGYQDATPSGARAFRALWLTKGALWAEPEKQPDDWALGEQLEQIPPGFADE